MTHTDNQSRERIRELNDRFRKTLYREAPWHSPQHSGLTRLPGWNSHPLESAALSQRTPIAVVQTWTIRWSRRLIEPEAATPVLVPHANRMHNSQVSSSSGMPSLKSAVRPSPEPTHEALLAALADRDRELAEARERQTATAEILRVISELPTDAQPVFESIVLTAARLLNSTRAFVLLCDGGAFSVTAAASPEGVLPPRGGKTPIDPSANFPSRAILAKEKLYVPDYSRVELPEFERKIRDTYGVNSSLFLPLLHQGRMLRLAHADCATTRRVRPRRNRFGQIFPQPGSHRNRERAPVRRGAGAYARPLRGAATADRHSGRVEGHQPLGVRPAGGVAHIGRVGKHALRRAHGPDRASRRRRLQVGDAKGLWPGVRTLPK